MHRSNVVKPISPQPCLVDRSPRSSKERWPLWQRRTLLSDSRTSTMRSTTISFVSVAWSHPSQSWPYNSLIRRGLNHGSQVQLLSSACMSPPHWINQSINPIIILFPSVSSSVYYTAQLLALNISKRRGNSFNKNFCYHRKPWNYRAR